MNNYRNPNDILSNWGSSKQKLSLKNDALKNEVLSKVSTLEYKQREFLPQKSFMRFLPLGFAALSILVFVFSSIDKPIDLYTSSSGVSVPTSFEKDLSNQASPESISVPWDGYGYGTPPINDNREFLKTSYGATIHTRHISELGGKIDMIVRGSDGRIDSSLLGDKHGYINFSIPSDRFSIFRDQIKSLTYAKLFTENISSENLLSQKQSIEERQKETQNNLVSLKTKRAEVVKNHTLVSNSFKQRINTIVTQQNTLLDEWQTATSQRREQINVMLTQLGVERNNLENALNNENYNYGKNISSMDEQIKLTEANMGYIEKEDQKFTDNIHTINGYISLEKISVWGTVDVYVPGPLLAWLLIVAMFVSYWRYRLSIRIYDLR